ncbi:MAG: A/G-specific adenine glycosylase [Spirochaetaceae bacterium]
MAAPRDELPLESESLLSELPEAGRDAAFIERVWRFHRTYRRPMAWRDEITPYGVFVSEVMLQQTQVARVRERYPRFLSRFPSFEALAAAPLREVLEEWSGLGYNRRGRFLQEAAKRIVAEFGGRLPEEPERLRELPGIGESTAGSIVAFAFNRPVLFLETNIRTVYIHYFFPRESGVGDRELLPIVERTLSREEPREWYYALMDLGVLIKARVGNLTRKSRSYTPQSPFKGSLREVRGAVLRLLSRTDRPVARREIEEALHFDTHRIDRSLLDLSREGLIVGEGSEGYRIPD